MSRAVRVLAIHAVAILSCGTTGGTLEIEAKDGGAAGSGGQGGFATSSSSSSGGSGGVGAALEDGGLDQADAMKTGSGGAGGEEPLPDPDAGCPLMNGGSGCVSDSDCPSVPEACGFYFTCDPIPTPPYNACAWHYLDGGPP